MEELDLDIIDDLENENNDISVQADYSYYEVVTRLNNINDKLDNQYALFNNGFISLYGAFGYLNFVVTLCLLYYFIRNLMGRG